MKKLFNITIMIILYLGLILLLWKWWNQPCEAIPPEFKSISPEIRKMMNKVGPYYTYKIYPDGRLEVYINKKWLKLRY